MTAFVVIVILTIFGVYHSANAPTPENSATMTDMSSSTSMTDEAVATSSQTYSYSCDADKSINATFHLPQDDFVNVNLSDGRHFILAHAISADGARYANANQAIVFWTKGITAFVQENGTATYSGCVANRFP